MLNRPSARGRTDKSTGAPRRPCCTALPIRFDTSCWIRSASQTPAPSPPRSRRTRRSGFAHVAQRDDHLAHGTPRVLQGDRALENEPARPVRSHQALLDIEERYAAAHDLSHDRLRRAPALVAAALPGLVAVVGSDELAVAGT